MNPIWDPGNKSSPREIRKGLHANTILIALGLDTPPESKGSPWETIGLCRDCPLNNLCELQINQKTNKFRTTSCRKRDSLVTLVSLVLEQNIGDSITFIKDAMRKAGF